MDIKNFLLKTKLNNVLHDVMIVSDTTNVRVYKTDGTYTKLSDELTRITNLITSSNDELYNKIMGFTEGDKTIDEAYDTLKEVAAFLEEHGDVADGMLDAITELQNRVGKYEVHYSTVAPSLVSGTTYYVSDSGEVAHYYTFVSPVDINADTDTCEFVEENNNISFVVTRTDDDSTEVYESPVTVTTEEPVDATNITDTIGEFSSLSSEVEKYGLVGDMVQAKQDIVSLKSADTTLSNRVTSVEDAIGKEEVEADEENGIEGSEATGIYKRLKEIEENNTKVEQSETNGNIKVDGQEVTVYTHPDANHVHITESELTAEEMVEGDLYFQLTSSTI